MVLTSSRPLTLLWPDGPIPTTPMAVVGMATATSVAERGGTVSLVGDGSSLELAASLVERIGELSVAYPHAANADPRAILTMPMTCMFTG